MKLVGIIFTVLGGFAVVNSLVIVGNAIYRAVVDNVVIHNYQFNTAIFLVPGVVLLLSGAYIIFQFRKKDAPADENEES